MKILPRLARTLGIAAMVTVACCLSFWWFYWSPETALEEKKGGELQMLRARVRKLEATMALLPKFKAEAEALEMRSIDAAQLLPEAPDNTGRFYAQTEIETLEELAARHGVRMEPPVEGPFRRRDLYFEQPLSFEVEGRRRSVRAFLEEAMATPGSLLLMQIQFEAHGSQQRARLDVRVHRMRPEDAIERNRKRGRRGGKGS